MPKNGTNIHSLHTCMFNVAVLHSFLSSSIVMMHVPVFYSGCNNDVKRVSFFSCIGYSAITLISLCVLVFPHYWSEPLSWFSDIYVPDFPVYIFLQMQRESLLFITLLVWMDGSHTQNVHHFFILFKGV